METTMPHVRVLLKKLPNWPRGQELPTYASAGAAGMDLRAAETVTVPQKATVLVKTGMAVAVPPGFEMQVRSRSGLAAKHAVFVTNGPGTIDADYRGEVGVILSNFGDEDFLIHAGDRIAQAVIAPVVQAEFVDVEQLSVTDRGVGGFGSTGLR